MTILGIFALYIGHMKIDTVNNDWLDFFKVKKSSQKLKQKKKQK